MTNLIVALVLAVIVGAAVLYLRRAKKRGVKCVGCPSGCACGREGSGCGGSCSGK